ncbi:Cytochrome c oxidase assembly factor 6-like protein [Trichoplax sp. H2]|nr:Cytochrome c oxidase assembly factor 6-like protein [Trichoplax sp. H2]|eukprot:RDD44847.1 Cytochrome c oxidase assembly factor 6-like protein [Trichoplax sp. H2]
MPDISATGRKACYRARDEYYECRIKNPANQSLCDALKKEYHEKCLPSWVSYFDRKRIFDDYKEKLEKEGFKIAEDNKKS